MENEIITKDFAVKNNLKHYFTNKPCRNGHIAKKFVSNSGCYECLKSECKKYYEKNKEYFAIKGSVWHKKNAQRHREKSKEWREKNIEKVKSMDKRWKEKNREKCSFDSSRRRAHKKSTGEFSKTEWLEIKTKYNFTCLSCKKQEPDILLTQDHIVPLSKGGLNVYENIQPLCQSCNCKKHTKTTDYR